MRLFAATVMLVLSGCSFSGQHPCVFRGKPDYAPSAGCLAVVHGKMLVVDSLTGGVTPPGGKSLPGESAQCTAFRETREETGLELIPGQLVTVFDTGFHLYFCEIHAASGTIEPRTVEVKRGYWLDIRDFGAVRWRYPGQGEALRKLLSPQTQDQPSPGDRVERSVPRPVYAD